MGQGDSAFIEFPGGKCALIDAGEAENARSVVSYLKERQCKKIDYLICTHPHSDHIGGMVQVLEAVEVGAVYMPRVSHTSGTFEKLLLAIDSKGLTVHGVKAGDSIAVEQDVTLTVVAPSSDTYEELNDYSLVLHLAYGETSFLFTGDAEKLSEQEMLKSGLPLEADVLKVGHHGSSTSSHKKFLEAVAPTWAVISCDGNNEYGHPHKEVVNRIEKLGIEIYRTDRDGTVMAISDGQTVTFRTSEGET